jgi:PKD repeat protein
VVTIQTGQGTLPQQTITATVDPNCGYVAVLYLASSSASITATTGCNGALQTAVDSAVFASLLDTAMSVINFNCGGGGTPDCLGVPGGPNVPGASCVDFFGNQGVWDANCMCVTNGLVDCLGLVNGPNMPGTACDDGDSSTVGDTWTPTCVCVGQSTNVYDCLGILNGPNMPGTACNDGDPNTTNDTWTANCLCAGIAPQNCQAAFSISQLGPFAMMATNQSTGVAPMTYQWWLPDGSTSALANPIYTFPAPGTYGICLTITAGNACTSVSCDTIYVDSTGTLSSFPNFYDCLQIPNGPNMPGTPCTIPGTIIQGTWSVNCTCDTTGAIIYDCIGIANGPNLPGTACTDSLGGIFFTGVWDVNCACVTNGLIDCLGQLNGPALPGTPCDDGNPVTINDTWNATCQCVGGTNAPCQASFWVLQAFTVDSLNNPAPIPYEVWVWNLSSGGSGTYTYLWNFGDGTSSTAQFPTHTYSGNGPYLLCLTIDDGAGCTSTFCDSVSIDANGIYNGIMAGGNDRQSGFTLNVQQPLSTGVTEVNTTGSVALWPNPVTDDLNVAMTDAIAGAADVTVLDASGRVVLAERRNLGAGRNQLSLPTSGLSPGLYTLRIGNGQGVMSQRFVKTF